MKLNIKTFKDVIITKTISIKKIYCVFAEIEFMIMIKKNLIYDLDI